ncbi:MAG: extracellular solute-binding protein [Desulfurococcales archaeon]|nr:extracellular solute-binding protein [Desulfurococcales archaeon]
MKAKTILATVLLVTLLAPAALPLISHAAAPELTGDWEADVIAVGRWLQENDVTQVHYTVQAAGDPNSVMRMYGIVEAAHRINDVWSKNGINVEVRVDTNWESSFSKQFDNFVTQYDLGQNGDFFVNSYIYIATLAADGRLLDITPWVNKYWDSVFKDFYKPLMDAAKYQGKYYGIPQDTEARPLYIRKDVAKCMGWNLEGLDEKVKNGEFTWKDVYAKAKEAVEKGCSDWGLIHRKGSAHPDLIQFIFAFNGQLYDPDTGKLVVDKTAVYKWLATEKAFADAKLLPRNIMDWDWATQIHPTIVGARKADGGTGNTLFDIGGTWYWTEWQTKDYYLDPQTGQKRPLTPEEVKEKFYYTLFPAGEPGDKPVTLSQPFMWMIAANAGKDNPHFDDPTYRTVYQELAFLMVVAASDPVINAVHSVISAHVPVRKEASALLKDEEFINNLLSLKLPFSQEVIDAIAPIVQKTANPINIEFLANVSYMLDYTHLAPSHPYYSKLADVFKQAVDRVLKGQMTPEQAVKFIEDSVKADPDLSGSVEFKGSIPQGWSLVPTATQTTQPPAQTTTTTQPASPETTTTAGGKGGTSTALVVGVVVIIIIIVAAYLALRGKGQG